MQLYILFIVWTLFIFTACQSSNSTNIDTKKDTKDTKDSLLITKTQTITSNNLKNYPPSVDGLAQLAQNLKENSPYAIELLNNLQPTMQDCQAIVKEATDAQLLLKYAIKTYSSLPTNGLPLGDKTRTEVMIQRIESEEIRSKQDTILRSYQAIAAKLQDSLVLYKFTYTKPTEQLGMMYDGMMYIRNKWVFIPRFYKAFESK